MIGLVGKGKGVGVMFVARTSSSHVTLLPHYKQKHQPEIYFLALFWGNLVHIMLLRESSQ